MTVTIRLDESRPYSEVRGERAPDDPHYHVAYFQDGLPFNVNKVLVPEDTVRTAPWESTDVEGKKVLHRPLYNDNTRKIVQRKIELLEKGQSERVVIDEHSDSSMQEAASQEVNFSSWLRGEIDYQWWQLKAAAKVRFHKNYTNRSELIFDAVYDERVIPENQVHQTRINEIESITQRPE